MKSLFTAGLLVGLLNVILLQSVTGQVVISQVYGGGGNLGATFTNDFIELFNRGTAAVNIGGWSVQYASSSGTTWQRTNISVATNSTLQPGQYFLVQQAAGTGGTTPLPTADATGTISMAGTAGKVALVNNQASLTDSQVTAGRSATVVDFVGFGATANAFEGTGPTANLSNTVAALRGNNGCEDTDDNSADFITGAPIPRNSATTIAPCGVTPGPTPSPTPAPAPGPTPAPGSGPTPAPTAGPLRIRDIQGAAHISPVKDQTVSNVPGTVTARRNNGFYIQDPLPDNDVKTSEGIFVFTNSAPAANIVVGAGVLVSGRVIEFAGAATALPLTEISGPTTIVLATNQPLPAPVIIGVGGRIPPNRVIEDDAGPNVETNPGVFEPNTDGLDFYESLEGMLVQINNAVAVSPTNNFNELWVLGDNGDAATGRTPRGGIVISPGDFNPERIQIDDTISSVPKANVGDRLSTPLIGVVDYAFNNYEVLIIAPATVVSGGIQREATALVGTPTQLTVATFNVENLDAAEPDAKFNGLAAAIVNNLKSPDVIGIEEIQDNNGPTPDAVVDASATWNKLIAAIAAAGGPTYRFTDIPPVDDQDGGEPGGNIRVGYLYNPDRITFISRPGGTSTNSNTVVAVDGAPQLQYSPGRIDPTNTAFQNSRKPLAAEFEFNGQKVFMIVNHFNSKGGDQPLFGKNQPPVRSSETQRREQAAIVANFVNQTLAIDPAANIVVLGDINDFQFSEVVEILEYARLTSLVETLPLAEQYTYNFEGNAQVLDHILASPNLRSDLDRYDVVHFNSEFADQLSDHDPSVARFNLPVPAPKAVITITNDTATTRRSCPVTIDVLANDTVTDNLQLVIASASTADGTASVVGGKIQYTPSAGASTGTAVVTYVVNATNTTTGAVFNTANGIVTIRRTADPCDGKSCGVGATNSSCVSAACPGITYTCSCDASKGLVATSNSSEPSCRFANLKCFLKPGNGNDKDDKDDKKDKDDNKNGDVSIVMKVNGKSPVPLRFSIGSQPRCLPGFDVTGGAVPTVQQVDCKSGNVQSASTQKADDNKDKDDDKKDDKDGDDKAGPLKCEKGIYTYTLRSSAISKKGCYKITLSLVDGSACAGVFSAE
eukprot:jgi/Chrzof1/8745/Cz03g22230.t1